MTLPPIEREIRAQLAVARFMQAYLPLSVSHWLLKLSLSHAQLPAGVTRAAVSATGVPCDWLIPANAPAKQVLLYLHGGGFVLGQTPLHLQMGAYLAQKMSLRVLNGGLSPRAGSPIPGRIG